MALPRLLVLQLRHFFEENQAFPLQTADTLENEVQLFAKVGAGLGWQLQLLWLFLEELESLLDDLDGAQPSKESAPWRSVRLLNPELLLWHILLLRLDELRQSSLLLVKMVVLHGAGLAAGTAGDLIEQGLKLVLAVDLIVLLHFVNVLLGSLQALLLNHH